MNESTPPQGSSLPIQVDLTADVGPEGPLSAPAAKKARLSLQQPGSSGSSATGRPQGTLWAFFTRSSQNKTNPIMPHFVTHATLLGPVAGF